MISAFFVFLLLGLITYVYFSFSLLALLLKLDTKNVIEKPLALIFSLALAPYITSILLHYLLWLVPFQSNIIYVFIIILTFTLILFLSKSKIAAILEFFSSKLKFSVKNTKGTALILDNKFFKIYTNHRYPNFRA